VTDGGIMTGSTLTLACDDEAGQVVLEDLPCGPAGEAALIPVDGVELLFDNTDGRLTRLLVDLAPAGSQASVAEPALAFIHDLLGAQAAAAIEKADHCDGTSVPLRVPESKMADLSRLARLDAARMTSPVGGSPGWAVEAAQLAARAGLTGRAAAEARRATAALAGAPPGGIPAALVNAVADTVHEIDPGLARRLREDAALPRSDWLASAQPDGAWSAVRPRIAGEGEGLGEPQRWLDPQTVPPRVFRHHLWPDADLTVRVTESGLRVEAQLLDCADRAALARCWVRLVNPARRTVIAMAPFRDAGGLRVTAELSGHKPCRGAWVEVADDPGRPVLSAQLRRMRRAMRWADAALCAGRRPPGLTAAEWDRLAGQAWKHCAEDWSAARDYDRAYLAAERAAAFGVDVEVAPPPSQWAKDLAGRCPLGEAPFLAETMG
jgi:hypothetical protein